MNESTITQLLNDELDFAIVRDELIEIGRNRQWKAFLHQHHIEPERTETINLTPLEHLAIHICFAKIYPSDSSKAKVACFVKTYPGRRSDHTPLSISDKLKANVLSFGQSRRDSCDRTLAHARTFIDKEKHRQAVSIAAKNHKGRECAWKHKVSATMLETPMCCCIICGKEMKAISGNITQHQRSSKCRKSM